MDRPIGPRQPDKRHAAYEDIFGRPGASHHIPANIYPQPPPQPSYPYHDKRTSHSSQLSYQNPQPYRQSQSQYPQHLSYPQHIPPYTLSPHLGRASSALSNPHIPPNSSLESLTPSGLTPAQAYQQQIFLDNPASHQSDWNRYRNSPGPSNRNGASTHLVDPPRLGVSLDHNDGQLGLDFAGPIGNGGSTNSSPQDTDDGSSELPWMRVETTGAISMSLFYCCI
jgi:RHO1 GDP-GTP exchange protein 1/2